MNDEQIFRSLWWLNFKNPSISESYKQHVAYLIRAYSIYHTGVLFVISVAVAIVLSTRLDLYWGTPIFPSLISAYTCLGIYCILIVLSLIYKENNKILQWINYTSFYVMIFLFGTLRNHIINVIQADTVVYTALCVVEIIFRLGYLIIGTMDFFDSVMITATDCVSYWLYWSFIVDIQKLWFRVLIFNGFWLIEQVCFYFFLKEKKRTFFYRTSLEQKFTWLNNIFDNMNTGFISTKGGEINYMNRAMVNRLVNCKTVIELLPSLGTCVESEENEINQNVNENEEHMKRLLISKSSDVLKFIFSDINLDHLSFPKNSNAGSNNRPNSINDERSNYDDFFINFKTYTQKEKFANVFCFIGTKIFDMVNHESGEPYRITYEVYCRFYSGNNADKIDEFEFIFNDVTRTEIVMERRALTKYKGLFLSKIAHEFKNPLVCITELSDQIGDIIGADKDKNKDKDNNKIFHSNEIIVGDQNGTKISSNLSTFEQILIKTPIIRALSNYLLILIKDLDYFSKNQAIVQTTEIDLKDLADFCEEVGLGLLENRNKAREIKFIKYLSQDLPPRILLDEGKIKQILLNLTSNAIKFTNKGNISLNIIRDQNFIKFEISDTGCGISDSITDQLFVPSIKGYQNSKDKSGLGLTIVKEICAALQSQIQFSTKVGEGSKFWFLLPIIEIGENSIDHNINRSRGTLTYSHQSSSGNCVNKPHPLQDRRSGAYPNRPSRKALFGENKSSKQNIFNYNNNINEEASCISDRTVELKSIVLRKPVFNKGPGFARDSPINNNNNNYFISNKIVINQQFAPQYEDRILKQFTFPKEEDSLNIVLVDDENITRKSALRMLNNVARERQININIIEAEDGIEGLYIVFKYISQGWRVHGVVSDETMVYINGSIFAQVLKRMIINRSLDDIPFFIVTAYEDDVTLRALRVDCIEQIFSKPLAKLVAEKIIEKCQSVI